MRDLGLANNWDVCVVGIDLKKIEVQQLINEDFLNDLDREYEVISYNYHDRHCYTVYLKIRRDKDFTEVIEEAVNVIISKPLRDDLLVEDIEKNLNRMPNTFKVKPVAFKGIKKGEKWTLAEFNQIRNYVLAWKELAKIIFYFTQLGEGEDLLHYLWREHPAIFSEIQSRKEFLKGTILAEFANILDRFEKEF
ncbi:MAG: hypothetical protein ACOC5L_03450 [Halobacteriota archaeon]